MASSQEKTALLQKRPLFLKNHLDLFPVFLVCIIGITSTGLIFSLIHKQEQEAIRKTFDEISIHQTSEVNKGIKDAVDIVESLKAFYAASQHVDRKEFSIFSQNLLSKYKSIQAVEWVPLLTEKNRARYEAEARLSFPDFKIQKKGPTGTMIPVSAQDFYLPVYYVAPYEGNEDALGFDLASDPIREKAMRAAWQSGKTTATEPVKLVRSSGQHSGILVFAPIDKKNSFNEKPSTGKPPIEGFVLSVLKMDALLEAVLQNFVPQKIDLLIEDVSTEHAVEIVRLRSDSTRKTAEHHARANRTHDLIKRETFSVAGRTWQMTTTAFFSDFEEEHLSWKWGISLIGLIVTGFFSAYFITLKKQKEERLATLKKLEAEVVSRRALEARLNLSRAVFDNAREGIVITDARRKIISVNPAFTSITGYTLDDVRGEDPNILKSGRHDDAFYAMIWESIDKNKHWQGEIWDKKKSGAIHAKWLSITAIEDQAGNVQQYIGLFSDITERKTSEKRLHFQAYYDALTGLPNRRLLKDRLSQALNQAKRTETKVGLLFVDLDHFKHVNDTLGHLVGDTVLKKVTQRLCASVREADTVSRSGGDEFQIVLPNIASQKEALFVAKKIIEQISDPFQIKGREVFLGISIGITLAPDDGMETDTLLRNADMAMYKAKSLNRNTYYFFSEHMEKIAKQRAILEWDLRRALSNRELLIFYQPIIDLHTLKTVAVEALLRWQHPEQGLLLPKQFIPIAEETGLIRDIGTFVLQTACRQMCTWHRHGKIKTALSVNMSSHQFLFNDFMAPITEALETSGLPPELLIIEVTESLTLDPVEKVVHKLSQLKKIGIGLAIDDFGTGYSSLSYLARFPIDRLKIDKSFIQNIACNPQKTDIVEAIIRMGQSMKMEVIAEGIEKEEELNCVKALGCNAAQGFYFSKPLSVEGYDKVLSG